MIIAYCKAGAQQIISMQDFESAPAIPILAFTNTGGNFSSGTNAAGLPANANLFAAGTGGWQIINGTSSLLFANQPTGNYNNVYIEFRFAGMSVNSSNGIDGGDNIVLSVSLDGGNSFSDEIKWQGSGANQRWDFTAPGISVNNYDGDNSPAIVNLSSGTNAISTGRLVFTAPVSQLRIKLVLQNNDPNERWVVDELKVLGTPTTLPVSLLEFGARREGESVLLYWQTASEESNRGFELQRSDDSLHFRTLVFIPSAAPGGNSERILSYRYLDLQASAARLFYRIRQVDLDGHGKIGPIRSVGPAGQAMQRLRIFPNPVSDILLAWVMAENRGEVEIRVLNMQGQCIARVRQGVQKGENKIRLMAARWPAGSYWLQLKWLGEEKMMQVQVLKCR
jgi:hypothetical protein